MCEEKNAAKLINNWLKKDSSDCHGPRDCYSSEVIDNSEYLERLWNCYQDGIKNEKLPEKDLFLALIDDLIHQVAERYAGEKEIIRNDDNGELDEIVLENGYAHLERMDTNHWSLQIGDTVIGLISTSKIEASGL